MITQLKYLFRAIAIRRATLLNNPDVSATEGDDSSIITDDPIDLTGNESLDFSNSLNEDVVIGLDKEKIRPTVSSPIGFSTPGSPAVVCDSVTKKQNMESKLGKVAGALLDDTVLQVSESCKKGKVSKKLPFGSPFEDKLPQLIEILNSDCFKLITKTEILGQLKLLTKPIFTKATKDCKWVLKAFRLLKRVIRLFDLDDENVTSFAQQVEDNRMFMSPPLLKAIQQLIQGMIAKALERKVCLSIEWAQAEKLADEENLLAEKKSEIGGLKSSLQDALGKITVLENLFHKRHDDLEHIMARMQYQNPKEIDWTKWSRDEANETIVAVKKLAKAKFGEIFMILWHFCVPNLANGFSPTWTCVTKTGQKEIEELKSVNFIWGVLKDLRNSVNGGARTSVFAVAALESVTTLLRMILIFGKFSPKEIYLEVKLAKQLLESVLGSKGVMVTQLALALRTMEVPEVSAGEVRKNLVSVFPVYFSDVTIAMDRKSPLMKLMAPVIMEGKVTGCHMLNSPFWQMTPFKGLVPAFADEMDQPVFPERISAPLPLDTNPLGSLGMEDPDETVQRYKALKMQWNTHSSF